MVSEPALERNRLAFLSLMGVDVYVSRRPLPQALSSRIIPAKASASASTQALATPVSGPDLDLASRTTKATGPRRSRRSAAAVLSGVGATALDSSVPSSSADIARTDIRTENSVSPARVISAASGQTAPVLDALSRAVTFNLITVTYPSAVMFVSDIRQAPLAPVLESSVLSFLQDVMLALGLPQPSTTIAAEYFQWPLVKKAGIDASAATARDVLAGLISRKLRESQVEVIVLMGKTASTYIGTQQLVNGADSSMSRGVTLLQCEPLGKLFATPSSKVNLWHILQPFNRRFCAMVP